MMHIMRKDCEKEVECQKGSEKGTEKEKYIEEKQK